MVGKVPNLEPQSSGVRSSKHLRIYWSPFFQRWIAKQANRHSGPATKFRVAAREAFVATVQIIKQVSGDDMIAADQLARNTPFLSRDLRMKAASGLLFNWIDEDGITWVGRAQVYPDIQAALNSITDHVGVILVKTTEGWLGLLPGDAGDVLTMDGASGLPNWQPGGGGGGGALNYTFPIPFGLNTPDPQNYGARGQVYTALADIEIESATVTFNSVATGVYKVGVAGFNIATGKMLGPPIYSESLTAPDSAMVSPVFGFTVAPAISVGATFIMFIVRTDVPGTTSLSMTYCAANTVGHAGLWIPNSAAAYKLDSNNPTVSDTWSNGGAIYPIAPTYQIPL